MKEQQQQQQIKKRLSDFVLSEFVRTCGPMKLYIGDFEALAHVDQSGHTDFVMKE